MVLSGAKGLHVYAMRILTRYGVVVAGPILAEVVDARGCISECASAC
jgi:hypothetical protein